MSLKLRKMPLAHYLIPLAIILAGIGVDQLTKHLALRYLFPIPTQPLMEGVLHLTYVENRGAAWGMLADHRAVFMISSTVMILAIGVLLFSGHIQGRLCAVSLSLIMSGGIGNMIDRIFRGYVIDFIDVRLIHFPVFNGADSLVCIGACLLILSLLRDLVAEERARRDGGAAS